jgi:hypothetical protein
VSPVNDAVYHAPALPAVSSGDFPADLHGLRRCFPDQWSAFLRGHFQGAAHVEAFFGVDGRTARAWLNGKHGVNAAPVVMALRLIPGAVAALLEDA